MDFGSWLLGFIEAEGSFSINKGRYPHFSLGQDEKEILEKIQDFFKVGAVARQGYNWCYHVYGHNCWHIREFCESKLIITERIKQFEKWKGLKWLPQQSKKLNLNIDHTVNFADWLTGFIEGEGSFSVSGRKIYPEFSISQKSKEILEKIKYFFGGIGNIRKTGNKIAWQYTVSNRLCWVIRNFCEGKLVMKKRRVQFENWKVLKWSTPFYLSQVKKEGNRSRKIYKSYFGILGEQYE